MLKTILSQITDELKNAGVSEVYTAFDNIPMDKKGREIFTVVGIDGFESSAPIYSEYTIFLPFKAEVGISLIAPLSMDMARLYGVFDSDIMPLIDRLGSLTCSLRNITIKNDANIKRLVLKARFSVSGISKLERSRS